MEKVFKKICAIEESRELSRHSSNEDLSKTFGAQAPQTSSPNPDSMAAATPTASGQGTTAKPSALIVAEISMRELSDDGAKNSSKNAKEREHRRNSRPRGSGRTKPRSQSSSINNSPENSSCTIF